MPNIAPAIYAGLGVLCLVRGFFRPHRALVKEGKVQRCAGPNGYGTCDPADTLHSRVGEPVYAAANGEVVAVGQTFLHLLPNNDNVILMYDGVVPDVVEGQHVGLGQRIALVDESNVVRFSVTMLETSDTSPLGYQTRVVPPSGWLAARGIKHFVRDVGGGTEYCEGGRSIVVPSDVNAACNMVRPEPGRFGLLPVNVDIE